MMATLLDIRNITISFGGLIALNRVDFQIEQGSILGIIGPNGAGKTTLLNVITGIYKPDDGTILFGEKSIQKLKPYAVAQLGIARTFQTLGLFPKMTVLENLFLGLHGQLEGNVFSGMIMSPGVKRSEKEGREKILEGLSQLGLSDMAQKRPADLPFGHCKLLEICRALLSEPKLLLLDEPTSGLSPKESQRMGKVVDEIRRKRGMTILLIEHNIPFIQSISDKLGVLNFGIKIAEGKSEEVLSNSQVMEAYLGKETAHT